MIYSRSYSKCDQAELQSEVQFQGSLLSVTMHSPMIVAVFKVRQQGEVVPFTEQIMEKKMQASFVTY